MEDLLFNSAALLQRVKNDQVLAVLHLKEKHAKLSVAASEKIVNGVVSERFLINIFTDVQSFKPLNAVNEMVLHFQEDEFAEHFAKYWDNDTRTLVIGAMELAINRFDHTQSNLGELLYFPEDLVIPPQSAAMLWEYVKDVAKCVVTYTYTQESVKKPILFAQAIEAVLAFYSLIAKLEPNYQFVKPNWLRLINLKNMVASEPSFIQTPAINMAKQVMREWLQTNPSCVTLLTLRQMTVEAVKEFLYLLTDTELEDLQEYHLQKIYKQHKQLQPTDAYMVDSYYDDQIIRIEIIMAWKND